MGRRRAQIQAPDSGRLRRLEDLRERTVAPHQGVKAELHALSFYPKPPAGFQAANTLVQEE